MGLNFDGVNETTANKLRALASDGKITQEEVKGLTAAEQEELRKALGGTLPKGDIVLVEPKEKKAKEKNFFTGVVDWFKDDEVPTWQKVGVGVLGPVVGAVLVVKAPIVAVAAGLLGLTGCSTSDVEVNVKVSNTSIEELAEYYFTRLEQLFKDYFNDINKIVEILNAQQKSLAEIVSLLKANGKQNEEIYNALIANGAKLDAIIDLIKENMDAGDKHQQAMLDKLDIIAQLVQNGNNIDKNTQDVIVKILAKMDGLDQANAEEKAVLDALLAKLTQFAEQEFAMGEKTHMLLHSLIEAVNVGNKMDTETKDLILKLIDMVNIGNKIDKDTYELLLNISEKIGQLENSGKDNLKAILDAILAGNEVAKGTQEVALKILEAVGSLNDKGDKALEVLNKLSMGDYNVDLEDLKAFLTATVKGIMDSYTAGNEKVLAKLQEILDKIPEGCHCDLSEILIKLEKIITVLESDDENHEGILGDLDSIVNGG